MFNVGRGYIEHPVAKQLDDLIVVRIRMKLLEMLARHIYQHKGCYESEPLTVHSSPLQIIEAPNLAAQLPVVLIVQVLADETHASYVLESTHVHESFPAAREGLT